MAIIGNQNPIVGITYDYEISESFNVNDMLVSDIQYVWHLHKKIDGAWMNVTKDKGKIGKKVQYVFYEKVLGIPFRLEVYKTVKNILSSEYEATRLASLEVIPSSASSPKINRVVLFNRGAKDPNKASYQDTLIAQAQCVAMFNKEIEFQLWEDDAAGEGHDKNINKNNTTNLKFNARVNENGIAEVRIPLSSNQNVFKAIANRYLMQGDQNEGANHEYYVTASYAGQIKANQVNVNVANPDHGQKPKDDSFIGSGTSSRPPRHDGKGKIKDAYFVNSKNQKLSKAGIGNFVIVKILTENMKGKVVTLKIWEEDNGLDDLVFEKNIRLNEAESYYRVDITKSVFDKGYGTDRTIFGSPVDSDSVQQTYYIEIIPQDDSVDSKSFGLTSEGLMKVDVAKSPAVVQTSESNVESTCLCKELYKDLIWGEKVSCEFRKKIIKIAQGLGLPQENFEGANWLMAVIALETGRSFDPTVGTFKSNPDDNRNGGYVGLIQFGKGASIDLGVKRSELIEMSAEKQLDYVEKYFSQKRFQGKLKTKTDLYLAVNYPKACGHGTEKDYVVYDSSKAAYDDNPMFKRESHEFWIDKRGRKNYYEGKEGKSYVWEFEEAINDFYNEGKNVKPTKFNCQNVQSSNTVSKDIITYHIYSDGSIEKHIPKVIKEEYKKKYKYVYHDKDANLHEMGTYDIIPTQMFKGKNGVLINLIDFDKVTKTYKKENYQYTFNVDSPRKYVNEKTLASLFGAMLEVNYNDISCNGFSHSDGSSRPSVSHINGNNGDFKYLRKDKKLMFGDGTSLDISANPDMLDDVRQNKWNDALYKFGWKSMLGWTYTRDGKINYLHHLPKNTDNHHHHLHLQGYSPNYKEIKE